MIRSSGFSGKTIACKDWLTILDELNIGAFMVGRHRRIESLNLSAQAMIGVRESDAIGKDCREVFLGVPCLVSCPFKGPQDVKQPEPVLRLPGEGDESYLVTRIAAPVYGADRQVVGCLTILQDHAPIADLVNRIHYEERSLKIILDNLDVGIFTVDRGGVFTFFNTAAEKISGFSRQEVLGRPCAALFREGSAAEWDLLRETIASGSPRSGIESRILTREGVTVPIRATYLPLRNEKEIAVGGLATFSDLTLVHQLSQAIQNRYTFHDMVGKSPQMQRIFENVRVVAKTDATVLIEGPTGTGKDVLAKVIHSASRRSEKPLVKVNCAAIPDTLLESEMFGYVKGAFTGAVQDRIGRFQAADGGTIFLDEIGDLPLALQAKLLRVIEEKVFFRLGTPQTTKVDVRIISASNQKLEQLVARKRFREDLYYRLNVFRIDIPSLKDRPEDLPLLVGHIMRRLCTSRGVVPPEISENAMQVLLNYTYPGNIRELENILEHALILCSENTLRRKHLPDYLRQRPPASGTRPEKVKAAGSSERTRILAALRRSEGSRALAARSLGMDRSTLWRKMRKYQLNDR
ncbi:MAG: sigma 54-interacting transcriptional regulator [Deltaproteobacteria bacterium]|nr:sigma 54-interacting transcriptional regulator [Deltaproteobacteria bacterium]